MTSPRAPSISATRAADYASSTWVKSFRIDSTLLSRTINLPASLLVSSVRPESALPRVRRKRGSGPCTHGTVTLVENWSGTVGFGAAAMKHRSVVYLSDIDGRGDFPPDREAVSHLGTPFGCGQSVPARPKMR